MFKPKFIISAFTIIIFLITTPLLKNETRVLEKKILNLNLKILSKKQNLNEAQLDYHYITSPTLIEKKLSVIGFNNYQPIEYSKIFFSITDLTKIQNKISNLDNLNEKKIEKK